MTQIFHSMQDVTRYVSDRIADIELEYYDHDHFEEAVEQAVANFLGILETEYDWHWGKEVPEHDIDLFELISNRPQGWEQVEA